MNFGEFTSTFYSVFVFSSLSSRWANCLLYHLYSQNMVDLYMDVNRIGHIYIVTDFMVYECMSLLICVSSFMTKILQHNIIINTRVEYNKSPE